MCAIPGSQIEFFYRFYKSFRTVEIQNIPQDRRIQICRLVAIEQHIFKFLNIVAGTDFRSMSGLNKSELYIYAQKFDHSLMPNIITSAILSAPIRRQRRIWRKIIETRNDQLILIINS